MNAAELVQDVKRLVSLPEVCTRIHEMLEDEESSASDIGKVISKDVDLTARLLKVVNSSFYGYPAKVDTVERAVTIVGTSELFVLVLATSAVTLFKDIPGTLLNMATFWRHSVYCGVVARLLAERCNVLHSERLFIVGLLHDIGRLVILYKLPETAQSVLTSTADTPLQAYRRERELLGFDHAEVGAEMTKAWGLPISLQQAIQFHHEPQHADRYLLESCIVHLANVLTTMVEQDGDFEGYDKEIHPVVWQTTGLDPRAIEPVLTAANPQFGEALELILPKAYRM